VSYQLSVKSAHTNGGNRKDNFAADRSVPIQFRSLEEHYDEPVYDRGHMAPSAVIDQTQLANDQTFLYSNMTPQLAHFNRDVKPSDRGAWGIIEDSVSCWVRDTERHHLLVTAGTIVDDPNELMNDEVVVPSQFFKIVLDMQTFETISFLLDHAGKTDHLIDDSIVTIAEIEAVTGLAFFPNLGEEFRAILLTQEGSLDDWTIRDRMFGNCVSRTLPDGP
jgi:endonuclease G